MESTDEAKKNGKSNVPKAEKDLRKAEADYNKSCLDMQTSMAKCLEALLNGQVTINNHLSLQQKLIIGLFLVCGANFILTMWLFFSNLFGLLNAMTG